MSKVKGSKLPDVTGTSAGSEILAKGISVFVVAAVLELAPELDASSRMPVELRGALSRLMEREAGEPFGALLRPDAAAVAPDAAVAASSATAAAAVDAAKVEDVAASRAPVVTTPGPSRFFESEEQVQRAIVRELSEAHRIMAASPVWRTRQLTLTCISKMRALAGAPNPYSVDLVALAVAEARAPPLPAAASRPESPGGSPSPAKAHHHKIPLREEEKEEEERILTVAKAREEASAVALAVEAALARGPHGPEGAPRPPIHHVTAQLERAVVRAQVTRCVRVYLCTSFADMGKEREALFARALPGLQQACLDIGVRVHWIDPSHRALNERSVYRHGGLAARLAEIDSARPYFVGLVGDMYGWHQAKGVHDLADGELLGAQSRAIEAGHAWLSGNLDRSLFELELLYGALAHPSSSKGTILYLRDPAYAAEFTLEADKRAHRPESSLAAQRLDELKEAIHRSGLNYKVYRRPADLPALVLSDLLARITRDFRDHPADSTEGSPSRGPGGAASATAAVAAAATTHSRALALKEPSLFTDRELIKLDAIHARHAADAAALASAKTPGHEPPRMALLDTLVRAASDVGASPLVLQGPAGSGLTSLCARAFVEIGDLYKRSDKVAVLFHSMTLHGAAESRLIAMRRILRALSAHLRMGWAIPARDHELPVAFAAALAELRSSTTDRFLVLVLDGIARRDLEWLPEELPRSFRLIAAAEREELPEEALLHRSWRGLDLPPLKPREREDVLASLLRRDEIAGGLHVEDEARAALLTGWDLAGLPGALDLAVRGVLFEALPGTPLSVPPPGALRAVLGTERLAELPRLCAQLQAQHFFPASPTAPSVLHEVVALVFASLTGLFESEIVAVLPAAGPRWSDIRRCLVPSVLSVSEVNGRVTLRGLASASLHPLPGEVAGLLKASHSSLAAFFSKAAGPGGASCRDARLARETAHHLVHSNAWKELAALLANVEVAYLIARAAPEELVSAWQKLRHAEPSAAGPSAVYGQKDPPLAISETGAKGTAALSEWLARGIMAAEVLTGLDEAEAGSGLWRTLSSEATARLGSSDDVSLLFAVKLAEHFVATGALEQASVCLTALASTLQRTRPTENITSDTLIMLSQVYRRRGDYHREHQVLSDALALRENVLGLNHLMVADILLRIGTNLFVQASAGVKSEPPLTRDTLAKLRNQAEVALERALRVFVTALGPRDTRAREALLLLAVLAVDLAEGDKAMSTLAKVETLVAQTAGPESAESALVLLAKADAIKRTASPPDPSLIRAIVESAKGLLRRSPPSTPHHFLFSRFKDFVTL